MEGNFMLLNHIAKKKSIWIVLIIALLIIIPFIANTYWLRMITFILMYAALAEGWNIMGGFTGYISFGHAAFFGIGAYTAGILSVEFGTPLFVAIIMAGIVSLILSFLLGLPILKLKGHYFALVTFGIAEAIKGVINNLTITGGGKGLSLPIIFNYYLYYYLFLGLMLLAVITAFLVRNSRLGYGLIAIRENEEGAAAMGINTTKFKVIAFAISTIIFGLAGAIYANWITFIETPDVFSLHLSVAVILITLLGGSGTVYGPIVGALFYQGLSELLWNHLLILHRASLGLIMIIVIMFIPKGFMEVVSGRRKFSWNVLRENLRCYSE
jgi:branched-chain amino acid transport system permease protein